MSKPPAAPRRPIAPSHMGGMNMIAPAPELREWMLSTFIAPEAPLHNPEHKHLALVDFQCLWAETSYGKQGRTVLGLTEQVTFRVSGWQRWRAEQQLLEWFEGLMPDYLITIASDYWNDADEAEACALVEHELYHIGHKRDEFGAPAFTEDGMPKTFIRGHDVEEFVGVVQRYGVGDDNGALAKLVRAANRTPEIGRLRLQQACGTCLLRAVG